MPEIIILGGGPAGLGAAWQLKANGHQDWLLFESDAHLGGLASSFVDRLGFTWDIGGHVQFSHYDYFDRVMDAVLGADGWLHHQRESWVRIFDRYVPYPFQYNLHRLPEEARERCLSGLEAAAGAPLREATDFGEWIDATFGAGIAEVFLRPYNFKVWAYPPERLNRVWVGERVAVPDLERVKAAIRTQTDDVSWGPNNRFRFPRRGGTGAIWNNCARMLPSERLRPSSRVVRVDLAARAVVLADGAEHRYDRLVSTLPLDRLLRLASVERFDSEVTDGLLYSSSNIVGLGLAGQPGPELATKCWLYFPEDNCPFYRATIFSNYSPHNVPRPGEQWSLMAEVSESPLKPVRAETLVADVIDGALAAGLIRSREDIVSIWSHRAGHGYPTPGLHRDRALDAILPWLEARHVYSRGRFGLWKYEVSNQDHAFMQGVEIVERLLNDREEITAVNPALANSRKHPWPFAEWTAHRS